MALRFHPNPLPVTTLSTHRALNSPHPNPKTLALPSPTLRPSSPLAVAALSTGAASESALFRWAFPADLGERWRGLREFSDGAEEKVREMPHHLVLAVMASEDHRFLYHVGVDPFGIGRAVVGYPNCGGGSTITQQLVKNIFLTSERKFSRKFVEGILSLALERKMSKWQILYSYLSKTYWGHGKYGIESASIFYFGKHPSLLNVGESALLAGILPSPETLNPFTSLERGKSSQARALRRMVVAGFLDLKTALSVVSQPLLLYSNGFGDRDQGYEHCRDKNQDYVNKDIWNSKMANITFEETKNMERWAIRMQKNSHQCVH